MPQPSARWINTTSKTHLRMVTCGRFILEGGGKRSATPLSTGGWHDSGAALEFEFSFSSPHFDLVNQGLP
jgi:hypothetical protein